MTKIAKSHNTDYGNIKLYCIEYVAFGGLKYGFSKFKGTKTEKKLLPFSRSSFEIRCTRNELHSLSLQIYLVKRWTDWMLYWWDRSHHVHFLKSRPSDFCVCLWNLRCLAKVILTNICDFWLKFLVSYVPLFQSTFFSFLGKAGKSWRQTWPKII